MLKSATINPDLTLLKLQLALPTLPPPPRAALAEALEEVGHEEDVGDLAGVVAEDEAAHAGDDGEHYCGVPDGEAVSVMERGVSGW